MMNHNILWQNQQAINDRYLWLTTLLHSQAGTTVTVSGGCEDLASGES